MKYVLSFFVLFTVVSGYCQQQLVVMDVSGNVVIAGQQKKVTIGSAINDGAKINIPPGGKLLLVCGTGSYISLDKPGTCTVSSKALCKTADNTSLAKICQVTWAEFNKKEQPDDWRNHLENVGAVYRGDNTCYAMVDSNLRYINYYTGIFNLSWKADNQQALFLKVYDYGRTDHKPVLSIPVTSGYYAVSALKPQLKEGKKYFWAVTGKDGQCQAFNTLNLVSERTRDSVVSDVTAFVNTCITDKAAQQYIKGILLENKHFFADALASYKAAKRLSGNKKYADEVAAFVKRYGME